MTSANSIIQKRLEICKCTAPFDLFFFLLYYNKATTTYEMHAVNNTEDVGKNVPPNSFLANLPNLPSPPPLNHSQTRYQRVTKTKNSLSYIFHFWGVQYIRYKKP